MQTRPATVAIFLFAAVVAAPLAGAAAAKPPKPGQLSLTSSAPIITFGQKDTLSGQLKGGGAGYVNLHTTACKAGEIRAEVQ